MLTQKRSCFSFVKNMRYVALPIEMGMTSCSSWFTFWSLWTNHSLSQVTILMKPTEQDVPVV